MIDPVLFKLVFAVTTGTLLLLCALDGRGKLVKLMLAMGRLGLVKVLLVVTVVMLFGVTNECIQPLFHRQRSLRDLLANFKGAGGVAVSWIVAGLVWWGSRGLIARRK